MISLFWCSFFCLVGFLLHYCAQNIVETEPEPVRIELFRIFFIAVLCQEKGCMWNNNSFRKRVGLGIAKKEKPYVRQGNIALISDSF